MDDKSTRISAWVLDLITLLDKIETSPKRLADNEWKSVGKNGEVEFYY